MGAHWTYWAKFLSFGSLILAWLLVHRILKRPEEKLLWASLILANPYLLYWASAGMDTAFALVSVVSLVVYIYRIGLTFVSAFLMGALVFVRPDLMLFSGFLFFLYTLNDFLKSKIKVRSIFIMGVSFTSPILLYFLIHLYFFTLPFPTPAYFKGLNIETSGDFGAGEKLLIGLSELASLWFSTPILALALFLIVFAYLRKGSSSNVFSSPLLIHPH